MRQYEIRMTDGVDGDLRVFTRGVHVYSAGPARWLGGEGATLTDAEGCCVAVLRQPLGLAGIYIRRPGWPTVSVRADVAPQGSPTWTVALDDTPYMRLWGDPSVRAALQRGPRVVAESRAEGLHEYVVTCTDGVDPVLVISVLLAADHMSS